MCSGLGFLSVAESKITHMFDPDPSAATASAGAATALHAAVAAPVDPASSVDPVDPVDPVDAAACLDGVDLADLDGGGLCEAIVAVQDRLRADEWAEIALAARW